ncbi:MAG: ATP-binding protein [Spirochaetota bacterium]
MELDRLQNVIADGQARIGQPTVRRSLVPLQAPGKVFVCIGPRRAGKSTLLGQMAADLLAQGTARENLVFINFQDDRLKQLRAGNFDLIPSAYYGLYPDKRGRETVHFFLDEIQEAPGWELFVERMLHSESARLYLTGSSARLLSREIATQLRGRALTGELWPFSFEEYLRFRNLDARKPGSINESFVRKAFDEYWERGGFPELREAPEAVRVATHQEYLRSMVYRDIIERHDADHPRAILKLAERLVSTVANLYTVNRLTEYLRSLGFKVQKEFVGQAIDWFEDAFMLFPLRIWDLSLAKQNVNPRKIYMVDHAMAASCDASYSEKRGYLLENLVYTHLRRRTENLNYYKTRRGLEVDFRVVRDSRVELVQVSWSLEDEETRKRETTALFQAMEEEGLTEGLIVTRDEEGVVGKEGRNIHIIPITRFLTS